MKDKIKNLVVVESPTKAKTLNKYLGDGYVVQASGGHIRDLPKKRLGVDIDRSFTPEYILLPQRKKFLDKVKKVAGKMGKIYLAPDPDREGEAIAWHIAEEMKEYTTRIYRVGFNEITKQAVCNAIDHPSRINIHKVNAQQARRILDRLVGYMLSPLLWKRHFPGLSAGRVQSVALRLICEREREVREFKPEEFWTITSRLLGSKPPEFLAKLVKIKGKKIKINNTDQANQVVEESRNHPYIVDRVTKREKKKPAPPPFKTSTLQQEAFRRFKFPSKKTMSIAQQLYEGIELGDKGLVGLITYHRTDSTRISSEALQNVRRFINSKFGKEYLPSKPNVFKNKKGIQDAHEAIRPSMVELTPESVKPFLPNDAWRLYQLVWKRFVASQMKPAVFDETIIRIQNGEFLFEAKGEILKFPSYLNIYQAKETKDNAEEDNMETELSGILPDLNRNEQLELKEIIPKQNFTKPPARFSEALLIKELERLGIGRPSTYATIISKIKDRNYTETVKGKFIPTELGFQVTDFLTEHFPDVLDAGFTAELEEKLDSVEEGKYDWIQLLREFYQPFNKDLDSTLEIVKNNKVTSISTELVCEKCGQQMVLKWGRNGEFLACSGYPKCQYSTDFNRDETGKIIPVTLEVSGESCEKCGGEMVVKRGKFGPFLACSNYPKCKYTKSIDNQPEMPEGVPRPKCDLCGADMILKTSINSKFWGCPNYPGCKGIKPLSVGVSCPKPGCKGELVVRSARGRVFYGCSRFPNCKYTISRRPVPKPCPKCEYPFLVEKKNNNNHVKIVCSRKKCNYEERPKD